MIRVTKSISYYLWSARTRYTCPAPYIGWKHWYRCVNVGLGYPLAEAHRWRHPDGRAIGNPPAQRELGNGAVRWGNSTPDSWGVWWRTNDEHVRMCWGFWGRDFGCCGDFSAMENQAHDPCTDRVPRERAGGILEEPERRRERIFMNKVKERYWLIQKDTNERTDFSNDQWTQYREQGCDILFGIDI